MKQNKEEWDVVMKKLERIARLVCKVGELCEKNNLEEKDVPLGLRAIFESLVTELDGIKAALEEHNEVGRMKKLFLRKDMLQKVKQYDGNLANVLQTFLAELVIDVRFAQLTEGFKPTHSGPSVSSGPSDAVISMPREPLSPHILFGRDSELAQIIHMIFTHIGSHPAHIAILGPGGYGKSTLANAVLTHDHV